MGVDESEVKGERIRVLIFRSGTGVDIEGSSAGAKLLIRRLPDGGVTVNGKRAQLPLSFPPDGGRGGAAGAIYVNKRPYRGTIEVHMGEGKDEGKLLVVDELPLESYLVGLINSEVSSKWAPEAIKAQAVAARTYALHRKEKRAGALFDLTSTHLDQVYMGAKLEDVAAYRAVKSTEGEVLIYKGEPALTLYHSNAGGRTEAAGEVWGSDYKYLRPVKSRYDKLAPNFEWETALTRGSLEKFIKKAGYDLGKPKRIYVLRKSSTGRVKTVLIKDGRGGELTLTGEKLRSTIGYAILRSTMFKVKRSGETFVFKGRGSGHGVGLSQWGAKGMAEDGDSYRKILKHYYPGTKLRKRW